MKIYVIMEEDRYAECSCSRREYPRLAFFDESKAKAYCKDQHQKDLDECAKYRSYGCSNYWSYETIEVVE